MNNATIDNVGDGTNNNLSFDIIYQIYFYIDDYCTVNNFLFLCKTFRKNYMRNTAYKHKFEILYKNLFSFLLLLPENSDKSNKCDLDFFELLMSQSRTKIDKIMIHNDIHFIYNLYKNFFLYYLDTKSGKDKDISNKLSNIIILQGPEFINDLVILDFDKNKISMRAKYKNRSNSLKYIIEYYKRYNINWIEYLINQYKSMQPCQD